MPYIKDRHALDPTKNRTVGAAQGEGELNFQITRLCDDFIKYLGGGYSSINAAIGVLECAKLELYRRVAAPYEDQKCKENGDVYE